MLHNSDDTLAELKSDIRIGDNPQHCDNPDSVRQSARIELRERGYSDADIDEMENA